MNISLEEGAIIALVGALIGIVLFFLLRRGPRLSEDWRGR